MKPHVHLQGAGQEATVITSDVGNSSEPPTQATVVLTRNVSLRNLTAHNNGTGTFNATLVAPEGADQVLVADVTAKAQGIGTHSRTICLWGNGTVATLQGVTALAENGNNNNWALTNYSSAQTTVRGGSFTGLGGSQSVGIWNYGTLPTIILENVTALGEGGSYVNRGFCNDGGDATLRGGSFTGRAADDGWEATGICNQSTGILEAQSVTALGENGTHNIGLAIFSVAAATVRNSSLIGRGGGTAYGVLNENFAALEHVTALGEDGGSNSYGLANTDSATTDATQCVLEGSTNSVFWNSGTVTVSNSRLVGGTVSGSVTCVGVSYGATFYTNTCP